MLFGRATPKLKFVLCCIVLALLALVFLDPRDLSPLVAGGLGGGVVCAVMIKFFIGPFMARRHYRQYKAIHDEFTLRLLDEGVQFISSSGESILRWDSVLKWRQDSDYVLIFPMPRLYHIVPKSVAANGFDLEGLIERLRTQVGEAV